MTKNIFHKPDLIPLDFGRPFGISREEAEEENKRILAEWNQQEEERKRKEAKADAQEWESVRKWKWLRGELD